MHIPLPPPSICIYDFRLNFIVIRKWLISSFGDLVFERGFDSISFHFIYWLWMCKLMILWELFFGVDLMEMKFNYYKCTLNQKSFFFSFYFHGTYYTFHLRYQKIQRLWKLNSVFFFSVLFLVFIACFSFFGLWVICKQLFIGCT